MVGGADSRTKRHRADAPTRRRDAASLVTSMKSFVFFGVMTICAMAYADDVATLRQRLIPSILPREETAKQQMIDEADRMAAKMNADSTWDDLDFSHQERTYWSPEKHLDRTLLM